MADLIKERIAVVVVHGMGEQRPMDTLRSFVKGIRYQLKKDKPASEDKAILRSKPDSIGDIYETVRLSLESNWKEKRPKVDFYEFYWAHNLRGTTFSQTSTWIRQVVFRPFWKIPERLKPIWFTIWGIAIAFSVITYLVLPVLTQRFEGIRWLLAILAGPVVTTFLGYLRSFMGTTFLSSFGDVARYMTPEPDNVSERSAIRSQGITFLNKLHSIENRTKPTRIVLLAHSLGSIVAYDLLRLLWTEYNTKYTQVSKGADQPALRALNDFIKKQNTAAKTSLSAQEMAEYKIIQNNYFNEARSFGSPWLISDFITIGAALYAIDYFMVTNVSCEELIAERELPVSPPKLDAKDDAIYYREFFHLEGEQDRVGFEVANHGALFAPVRWTNIYYKSDFIGGNMDFFGWGVENKAIDRKSLAWFLPVGHTNYWDEPGEGKESEALKIITAALNLYE